MDTKIDVFGDGKSFVRLVDWIGDELAIVNAARVSFHNESKWEYDVGENYRSLDKKDRGLINFLLKNKHGSPFEQGFMAQFHIRLPIFVMREWVRHRVGFSINEESGRYVEMRPDFYIPERGRTQTGKPGAYKFEPLTEFQSQIVKEKMTMASYDAYNLYKEFIESGVAKEQARIILPLNLYTEIRWTCNARSLMNFLQLRNSEHAMYEIASYAMVLEDFFAKHMPTVHTAFVNNRRVAP